MQRREVQHVYDRLAPSFDRLEGPLDTLLVAAHRRRLLRLAQGRVLEVACGTGRNLPFSPRGCRVVGSDLSRGMLEQARRRRVPALAGLVQADASALPFQDASFDTVVITLALCTVPDPVAALREMARVCRPQGTILLLEHVRSTARPLAWLQDRLTPWQVRRIGCHLDRDTLSAVKRAGLRVRTVRTHYWGILLLVVALPPAPEAT